MSADIFLVHGSEIDAPGVLPPDAWYIVVSYGDDLTTNDIKAGPYQTNADAQKALSSGDWLYS